MYRNCLLVYNLYMLSFSIMACFCIISNINYMMSFIFCKNEFECVASNFDYIFILGFDTSIRISANDCKTYNNYYTSVGPNLQTAIPQGDSSCKRLPESWCGVFWTIAEAHQIIWCISKMWCTWAVVHKVGALSNLEMYEVSWVLQNY